MITLKFTAEEVKSDLQEAHDKKIEAAERYHRERLADVDANYADLTRFAEVAPDDVKLSIAPSGCTYGSATVIFDWADREKLAKVTGPLEEAGKFVKDARENTIFVARQAKKFPRISFIHEWELGPDDPCRIVEVREKPKPV